MKYLPFTLFLLLVTLSCTPEEMTKAPVAFVNIFNVKIDGKTIDYDRIEAAENTSLDYFAIWCSTDNNPERSLHIRIKLGSVGTYDYANTSNAEDYKLEVLYLEKDDGQDASFRDELGTITIDSYDPTTKRVKGSINATLKDYTKEFDRTIIGDFDVEFIRM